MAKKIGVFVKNGVKNGVMGEKNRVFFWKTPLKIRHSCEKYTFCKMAEIGEK